MKFVGRIILILLLILALIFLFGPRPKYEKVTPELPEIKVPLNQLDTHIALREKFVDDLKPGNEAKIIWNDSIHQKTKYSLVYLHGFSASSMEGFPVHTDFAKQYGMNLYLPRLDDHGRESINSFENITPKSYLDSAKDALSVASLLGDKVIIMACSTGATLGAYLAAHHPNLVEGLIFFSPNIDLYDPNSRFITWPWGKNMLAKMEGGDYHHVDYSGSEGSMYWNSKYHINGLVALKSLINQTMTTSTFTKINQATLLCSFYKDDVTHDKVVSHEAMQRFYNEISTPDTYKKFEKFPDVVGHVFTSEVFSDDYKKAFKVASAFAEEKLGLKSVDDVVKEIFNEPVL